MVAMSSRWLAAAALAVAVTLVPGTWRIASADVSRNVITAFKGELVITKGELPEGKNDKDTIAKIKGERLKELTGEAKNDVTGWYFHYTAFLSKTGATQLKMEFYTNDKDKKFVADKRIDGVDPKTPALSGEISIDEDEGLSKGKPYIIKLVTDKDVVVASTPLVMK
jgi:hypothetical protein